MKRVAKIKKYLDSLKPKDQQYIWNNYCEYVNYFDCMVCDGRYVADDIHNKGMELSSLKHQMKYLGDLSKDDLYYVDGYGWWQVWEGIPDTQEVAEFCVENDNDLDDFNIRELL